MPSDPFAVYLADLQAALDRRAGRHPAAAGRAGCRDPGLAAGIGRP